MKTNYTATSQLNSRDVLENVTLKKIIAHYPEAANFTSLIKFVPAGNSLQLDLHLLDAILASKIRELFD